MSLFLQIRGETAIASPPRRKPMDDKIIATFCLCDDLLKAMHHQLTFRTLFPGPMRVFRRVLATCFKRPAHSPPKAPLAASAPRHHTGVAPGTPASVCRRGPTGPARAHLSPRLSHLYQC